MNNRYYPRKDNSPITISEIINFEIPGYSLEEINPIDADSELIDLSSIPNIMSTIAIKWNNSGHIYIYDLHDADVVKYWKDQNI